jgi:hypothetical protein
MPNPAGAKHFHCTIDMTRGSETRQLGIFDTWEGGNVTADSTKYRPGNMGPQMSMGGNPEVDDITCVRYYDRERDNPNDVWIASGVGGARCAVKKQLLDDDGFAFGKPYNITGKLVGFQHPEHDSNSSDFALMTLVVAPTGEFANS